MSTPAETSWFLERATLTQVAVTQGSVAVWGGGSSGSGQQGVLEDTQASARTSNAKVGRATRAWEGPCMCGRGAPTHVGTTTDTPRTNR